VQTLPIGSESPYSYGSGFAVGNGDLIVTNYHVVSNVVMNPDRYRLEFLRPNGNKGALAVVAIDIVHDLAVVQGDTGPMRGLTFEQSIPDKGGRGFSIGFPEDQGLIVTEGIINGLSENSAREAIHFTGPINSGMSGGPAVNTSGHVFGANVSNQRKSQLISFVVPAKEIVALLNVAHSKKTPSATELFDDVSRQLQLNSRYVLNMLPHGNLPIQRIGHFLVPAKPGEFAQCYANNDKEADKLYHIEENGCYFKDETYVTKGLTVGRWSFSHLLTKAPNLGALRFASLLQDMMKPQDDTSETNRLHKKRWECQDSIIALDGTRAKAVICLRRYSRFENLYDIEFELSTLGDPGEAILSSVLLTGFGYQESMEFLSKFMGAIVWKP
jgi:hypothetical protein